MSHAPSSPRTLPRFEQLENRTVLSTLTSISASQLKSLAVDRGSEATVIFRDTVVDRLQNDVITAEVSIDGLSSVSAASDVVMQSKLANTFDIRELRRVAIVRYPTSSAPPKTVPDVGTEPPTIGDIQPTPIDNPVIDVDVSPIRESKSDAASRQLSTTTNNESRNSQAQRTRIDFGNVSDAEAVHYANSHQSIQTANVNPSAEQFDVQPHEKLDRLFAIGASTSEFESTLQSETTPNVASAEASAAAEPIVVEYLPEPNQRNAPSAPQLATMSAATPAAASVLEEALLDFLEKMDDIGREISETLAAQGWITWTVGAGVGLASLDLARRRFRRFRSQVHARNSDSDPLSWFPGLPGPFSTQVS